MELGHRGAETLEEHRAAADVLGEETYVASTTSDAERGDLGGRLRPGHRDLEHHLPVVRRAGSRDVATAAPVQDGLAHAEVPGALEVCDQVSELGEPGGPGLAELGQPLPGDSRESRFHHTLMVAGRTVRCQAICRAPGARSAESQVAARHDGDVGRHAP